jgi:alkylation response protein AidB-like acyl-CoA dehydrogenase
MDFELSEEQKEIKRAAYEFAKGEFDKDLAIELAKNHAFPEQIHKKDCQLGFIGIHYPEAYGGQGYGILGNSLVMEEFCRQDSSIGIALNICNFASEIILRFGNEGQKKKYLIPLTKGETISAGAFIEPDHGSDITQMFTTGTLDNGEFIINGTKTFISNGTIAKFAIVLCQTDPNVKPPYRG